MTAEQIIGMAVSLLDSVGMLPVLMAGAIVGVAIYAYNRFTGRD